MLYLNFRVKLSDVAEIRFIWIVLNANSNGVVCHVHRHLEYILYIRLASEITTIHIYIIVLCAN